jgi:predicted PurR-regulated permease PerM
MDGNQVIVSAEIKRVRPDTWLAAVWSLLLRIFVAGAVGYALYRMQAIIVVVLLAAMVAFTAAPVVDWLCRTSPFRLLPRHARRPVAAVIVFTLLAAGLVGLAVLIVQPLAKEIAIFSGQWTEHQAQIQRWSAWLQERYAQLPPEIQGWLQAQDFKLLVTRVVEQGQHALHRTTSSVIHLVELILIPVLAFSFLTESRPIKNEFMLCLPRHRVRDALYVLRQSGRILQSYAIGQLILAVIAGVTVWLMLTVLGIRYALAMAIVAAITRVIPVVGPLLGGIPIMILCALISWERALIVLIGFTVMHLVESKVVMPRLIGYRIRLHPAVVIIVLLIGAEFFGMWGMFLAAPIAAIVKVLFHHFYVRPHKHEPPFRSVPPAPLSRKEVEVERPAVAGIRGHSGAH